MHQPTNHPMHEVYRRSQRQLPYVAFFLKKNTAPRPTNLLWNELSNFATQLTWKAKAQLNGAVQLAGLHHATEFIHAFPASLAKFVFICETLVLLGGLLSRIPTCFILIVVTNSCYMPNSHTKPSNWELVLNGILCTITRVDHVNRSSKKMVELVFSSFWVYLSLSLCPMQTSLHSGLSLLLHSYTQRELVHVIIIP